MPPKKSRSDKAAKHEKKGDAHLAKGKAAKALGEFRKALAENPDKPGIYDKLIKARDLLPGEWGMEEFAESMSWAMKKQELDNPEIKQIHAKLTPEWADATKLVLQILESDDGAPRSRLIEKLVGMGETATRALIAMLLELRAAAAKQTEEQE